MSHHYSGPDFGFPGGDGRLNLTDLYVLPKPGDAGKSILIIGHHSDLLAEFPYLGPPHIYRSQTSASG